MAPDRPGGRRAADRAGPPSAGERQGRARRRSSQDPDVVKVTIFLTDMSCYAEVNETYGEAFGDSRPARSVAQVAALPRGAGIEVEMIAALDTGTLRPGQP
jgi:hypothetical protein